jgi:hypothetical protein
MRVYLSAIVLAGVFLASGGAWAADPKPSANTACSGANVKLCGLQINIPAGPVGAIQSFPLPERFVAREVIWQCVSEWGMTPFYRLLGDAYNTCALKRCPPGVVNVCGLSVDVNVETPVGETTKLAFPSDYFASDLINKPEIHAQCTIANGVRKYEVRDEFTINCNAFACRPTKLQACNSTVTISTASNLGQAQNLYTDDHRPVRIQCLSTNAMAPRYVAVDCYER